MGEAGREFSTKRDPVKALRLPSNRCAAQALIVIIEYFPLLASLSLARPPISRAQGLLFPQHTHRLSSRQLRGSSIKIQRMRVSALQVGLRGKELMSLV